MKKEGEYLICIKCGHKEKIKNKNSHVFVEKTNNSKEITIIEKEYNVLPVDEAIVCPQCGNKGAYFWSIQMRAGDEGETKFYRCTKCGYTWRVYD